MRDGRSLLHSAQQRVNPAWTPERERAARLRLEQAIAGRRVTRMLLSVVVAVVTIGAGIGAVRHALAPEQPAGRAEPRPEPPRTEAVALLMNLEDGSTVSRLSGAPRVTPIEIGAETTTLRLEGGEARFVVTPNPERRFRVVAGDASITVIGTIFRVAMLPSGVEVAVERGRVEVGCGDERRALDAGQQMSCSRAPAAPEPVVPAPSVAAPLPEPTGSARPPVQKRAAVSWRALAEEGDYRGAFARMGAEGPGAVRDEPADLLFAADVARLSGHAGEAVTRLERVVRAHAGDSRAPLAAFTLGRTLDELGRPREAADAFATARRLAPAGALAQDALAREVESWSRAGEATLARDRAKQYLDRYPSGRRRKAVRYHGGLE
jgi:TolA-binding protein